MRGEAQAAQVLPASLRIGGDASLALDPSSHLASGPDATFSRRRLKGVEEGVLQLGREEGRCARIVSSRIAQSGKARLVVASNEGADPSIAQSNNGGSVGGGLTLGNQPEGLEASCIGSTGCRLVVLSQFIHRQVWCQMYSSCHSGSIYHDLV